MTEVAGKRVAVLGGRVEGAASARWLLQESATVTVRDAVDVRDLTAADDLKALGATFVTGPSYLDDLDEYDLIVRSPGVPFLTAEIQAALTAGTPVTSHTKLFWERCPVPLIGITGTKGKGTTATLLRDMLEAGGKTVFVGGNIGTPPLEFLDRILDGDRVILELSSFQLQDLDRSPQLAIVTNLGEDHLDHHADPTEYATAKANLLKYQTDEEVAILNADDPGSRRFDRVGQGHRLWFGRQADHPPCATYDVPDGKVEIDLDGAGRQPIVSINDIPLPGPHNLENVMAAALAARWLGVRSAEIERAVIAFKPLPYHLESLGTINGVTYVNDSYSTGPTSTIPALESFDGPVVLVAGGHRHGSTKGISYQRMAQVIADRRVKPLVIKSLDGDRLLGSLKLAGVATADITVVEELDGIFPALAKLTKEGETVLFSPAATWLPALSYQRRGAWFSEQVARLEQSDSRL